MISCLVLTSCSNAISLIDNFAEDENYYDPTLPSPQFARTSLSLPHVYTEEDMDALREEIKYLEAELAKVRNALASQSDRLAALEMAGSIVRVQVQCYKLLLASIYIVLLQPHESLIDECLCSI